ncbi:hypothetical protein CGZ75_01775 [Paenibacillus herberti]|uniref:Insertion element IS402-like domain-containing protein n=1 Tax=Paenibacillus herberti TaxID=1619309 RepID=A0A229NZU0_9BACL|nr:hypothetical protein CGZ75_01775 [Paenibacillus herberti]
MLNAMLWAARTGAPWRDLPEYYGSWFKAYSRFRRWQKSGVWDKILEHVSIEPDFELVLIDTTIVRVHQHGSGVKGGSIPKPWIDPRWIKHQNPCRCRRTWESASILADRAYDINRILDLLHHQKATPIIPSKKNRRKPRQGAY